MKLKDWIQKYLQSEALRNLSPQSLKSNSSRLSLFQKWCEERSLEEITAISRPILEGYQRFVSRQTNRKGEPLQALSQWNRLVALRSFFGWLVKRRILIFNPASELELPKLPTALPREILSIEEAEAILEQPNLKTLLGLRDHALLECLYSSGIRRNEVKRLEIKHVDLAEETLLILQGKTRRDRLVPLGKRACLSMQRYLTEARPQLQYRTKTKNSFVFLSSRGNPMGCDSISQRIRCHMKAAGVDKKGECHLFRHSMATLMLKNGADIRIIQEILGHAKITTTQIYTHLTIDHLKAVHDSTHPGRLERGTE